MSVRILALTSSGRPRNLSHTGLLVAGIEQYLAQRRPEWEFETLSLFDADIETCDGNGRCLRRGDCAFEDDVDAIVAKLDAANGILLASPNYFGNVNSVMLKFIERTLLLSHRRLLAGRAGMAVTTSVKVEGGHQAADFLTEVLGSYGTSVVEACHLGHPLLIRDFGDNRYGEMLRSRVDEFIRAVEDPDGTRSAEVYGGDVRQDLEAHPELLGRIFRSDAAYFESKARNEGSQEAQRVDT